MLCPLHEKTDPIDVISSRLYGVNNARLPSDARMVLALMVQAIGAVAKNKLEADKAHAISALGETALKSLHVGYAEINRRWERLRIEGPRNHHVRIIEGPSLEELESSPLPPPA